MTIIVVTISIIYAAIIIFLAVTWYKDMQYKEDTDKRILVLEKRIQEQHKCFSRTINDFKDEIINLTIEKKWFRKESWKTWKKTYIKK